MSGPSLQPAFYSGDKAEYVQKMFSGIAPRYDLLNGVLSFSLHSRWRRRAVKMVGLKAGDRALDICTGTGDFAVALFRAVGHTGSVIASDFCVPMLEHGRSKLQKAGGGRIVMMAADAMHLPYKSGLFDCVTVGFGIRNTKDAAVVFDEMARVVKPGGRVVCLEFNNPTHSLFKGPVNFYQNTILPRIGALLSRKEAYAYLPASIEAFHSREELAGMMRRSGLTDVRHVDLNFGSVCIHIGTKR